MSISKTRVHAPCGPHVTSSTAAHFPSMFLLNKISTVINNNKIHRTPENPNAQMALRTLQELLFPSANIPFSLHDLYPCALQLCWPQKLSASWHTPVPASLLAASSHTAHSLTSRRLFSCTTPLRSHPTPGTESPVPAE